MLLRIDVGDGQAQLLSAGRVRVLDVDANLVAHALKVPVDVVPDPERFDHRSEAESSRRGRTDLDLAGAAGLKDGGDESGKAERASAGDVVAVDDMLHC